MSATAHLPATGERDVLDATGRTLVMALAGFAGLAHLVAAQEHLAAWWGYGAFFVGIGVLQCAQAATLNRRPRSGVVLATVVVNVSVILVYVTSRTVGVPIGPGHDGHRMEAVGPLDLSTTAAEVLLVASLVPALPAPARRVVVNGLLGIGVSLWLLRAAGRLG